MKKLGFLANRSGLLWGRFRNVHPIHEKFGYHRPGSRVGRYYVDHFIEKNSKDIKGVALEIGENRYLNQFGGSRISKADILHVESGNALATHVGNLETGEGIPSGYYDCMVITQTFQCVYNIQSAIRNVHRALKKDGVLLASFSGISQISRYDMEHWGEYWRFTDLSVKRMFGEVFGNVNVEVATFGNVLTACAVLHGILKDELSIKELTYNDPDYQVIVCLRAVKR